MAAFINHNGDIIKASLPIFSATNRSFRYGDGIFESMRYMGGKLNFADYHAERLNKGAKALKFNFSEKINATFLTSQVDALCKSNKIFDNARIRMTIYRDGDGFYTPDSNKATYLMEMQAIEESEYRLNKKGLLVDLYQEIPKNFGLLSSLKTNNCLPYVMAGIYKNEKMLDECLLLNSDGNLVESISSNVFVWTGKELLTPSLAEGCIAGVMRKVCMHLAMQQKIKVRETAIKPEVLLQAEEIFLTNAAKGIQWVVGYKEKRYFNKFSKQMTDWLNKSSI